MKLVRLIYCSESTGTLNLDTVAQILRVARERNPRVGVTGFLCFDSNFFLQALEGSATAVNGVYAAICRDKRHHSLFIISYGEVAERAFPKWAMGDADLVTVRAEEARSGGSAPAGFQPRTMNPETALGLLIQLETLRRTSGEAHVI